VSLSVVIPTLGRAALLARALGRLEAQQARPHDLEVVVVADARERDLEAVRGAAFHRPFATRVLQADVPGASAARNVGWRSARAPLVLFIGDDILADPALVSEHLAWHERHPDETVAVLGDVRWAGELRVTPFMRWLEDGIQFDYRRIDGVEAGWGRFYTANVSLKRSLLLRAGGFDEGRLPYLYEDLDLARRLHGHGLRLLYNRAASAEHLHPVTLESWRTRAAEVAVAEREFTRLHPDVPAYFHELFSAAARGERARGRGVALARVVPRRLPWLGPLVWSSVDAFYRQQLAETFLAAWRQAEDAEREPAGAPR
jgi:GT2 family glycosyltransferase